MLRVKEFTKDKRNRISNKIYNNEKKLQPNIFNKVYIYFPETNKFLFNFINTFII